MLLVMLLISWTKDICQKRKNPTLTVCKSSHFNVLSVFLCNVMFLTGCLCMIAFLQCVELCVEKKAQRMKLDLIAFITKDLAIKTALQKRKEERA